MLDPLKPVNLPFTPPDLVGQYNTVYRADGSNAQNLDYHNIVDSFLSKESGGNNTDFSVTPTANIDTSGRYPLYYPGRDNESMYANAQTGLEKAYNGVVKMSGTASATFLEGTAGLVYGIGKSIYDQKFSSFYNNELTNSLNQWTQGLENTYAHYKTERERNGEWWEPSNLLSGNFLWDNIVKNLGFSLGAVGAGFAWGGALNAIGLTGKLVATGTEMAAAADAIVGEASILPEIERLSQVNSKLNTLWNSTKGKIGAGLLKSDQAIVATFGTVGEAGLEALNNSTEFRNNMIAEYARTHGYDPTGKDLEEINKNAEGVGNWSFWLNTALLTATNYVQLPKIYSSSFKSEKEILNNIMFKEGKYISSLPKEGFGKFLYKSKNLASLFFNTSEAFEEGAQYAIQTGTQNYFDKKYKNNERSALDDGFLYGVKEALTSSEGTLNIFTGGFSGALQSSGVVGIKKGMPTIGQTGKIGERGVFGYGGEEGKLREQAIAAWNTSMIQDKLKDAYSNIKASEIIQQKREAAVRQGDILESKDLEFDYAHNFITTRLKYNAKNAVDGEISDLRERAITNFDKLQKEGIATSTDTQTSFLNRLTNLQEHADNTAKMYETAKIKYEGMIDPKTKERVYSQEVIDKLVYAGSKILDYDKRIPQLNTPLAANGIVVSDILSQIVTEGMPKDEVVVKAIADIKALDSIEEDDLITNLRDLVELSLRRKEFVNEYKDIKTNPSKYKEVKPTAETETVSTRETITVNIKDGKDKTKEKEIEIGVDYLVGKIVEYDKKGNEVYRAVRIKVLGKTEDGKKLRIEDVATGNIVEVSPEKLADYQLGKASDATEKQIWIANNWNKIFVHKNLKDKNGKPREGRIENHPQEGKVYFKYIDEKGVEQKVAVTNQMFVPKPGSKYKEGVIAARDPLTAVEKKTFEEVFGVEEEITSEMISERNDYLASLHEEGVKRIEEINTKIEQNREALEKSAKDLEEKTNELTYTKKGTLRKSGFAAIQKSINSIKSVIDNLETHNDELNKEKAELEYTLPFYEEAISQLSEFKDDNSALIDRMKSQAKLVEDLLKVTEDTIKRTESLLENANDLFIRAVKAIEKFIDNLKESNPDLKTIFLDEYQESMEKFLGEEGARQILDNKEGYTRRLIEIQGKIAAFTDDMNLPKLQSNIDGLIKDIEDLNKGLAELTKENNKRKDILGKFQTFVDEQEQLQKEESLINKNSKVKKAALGTRDTKSVQTRESNVDHEVSSKKATNILPRATVGPDLGKAHQTRARNFGIRLPNLSNKDEIRGIYVTAKTEDALGIPGLMDRLASDERGVIDKSIEKGEIIAMVMVNTDGKFVNEFGEEITEGDVVDQAIFQVKPDPKFEWSSEFSEDGKPVSMFRKGTPQEVIDEVIKKYEEERAIILSDDYVAEPHTIAASFGVPVFVRDEAGNIDYSTRTSVKDADLVESDEALENKQVVIVPTKGDAETRGLVTYMNAVGKPFAQTENGLVPLQNRQHTDKEAENIFNVLVDLAKNMMNPKEGINGNKSVRLLQYLKSVVYWGVPENAANERIAPGYNSIFFEEDPKTGNLMLTISRDGYMVKFTPSELERNRGEVIDLIQDLYSNVNSFMVRQINDSYEQITSVNQEGEVESIMWPNYQSYLVSTVMPDSEGKLNGAERTDIPLTTIMKPVNKETGETNRTAVYFYTTDNAEDYSFAEIEKRVKTTSSKKRITAGRLNAQSEQEGTVVIHKGGKYTVSENEEGDVFIVNSKGNPISEKTEIGKEVLAKYFGIEEKPAETPETTEGKERNNPKEWKLDGDTENTYTTPKGTKVKFTAEKNTNASNFNKAITITDIENPVKVFKAFKKYAKEQGKKFTDEQIEKAILDDLRNSIFSLLPKAAPGKKSNEGVNPFAGAQTSRRDRRKPAENFSEEAVEKEVVEKAKKEKVKKAPKASEEETPETPLSRNELSKLTRRRREVLRKVIDGGIDDVTTEDWNNIEKFLKEKFPLIPFYRVKNLLENTAGTVQAWGTFRDGAIYLYENAEVGSVYHEVFEAIWERFTTLEERLRLIKEFKSRQGSFTDRPSGKTIEYSKADPEQIREQLAEECRDYFQDGVIPPKPGGKTGIVKFFADLFNTIRNFFTGSNAQSNTERLFENLGKGAYAKKYKATAKDAYQNVGIQDIEQVVLRDKDRLREKLKLSDVQRNDVIQEMTYATLARLVKDDKSLFEESALKGDDLYQYLYDDLMGIIDYSDEDINIAREDSSLSKVKIERLDKLENDNALLRAGIAQNWDNLVERHKEYLKGYQIEFDEDDNIQINEDRDKNSDSYDATKIDHFKKANRAVKLLLSTLPYMDADGYQSLSSIGGARLIPVSKVYVSLMNRLSDSNSPTQMLEKLREMAKVDPNYRSLYKRLTKQSYDSSESVNLSDIKSTHAGQLITAMWKTFKKYNAAVRNVTILETGEATVGEAHLSNVANQLRAQYQKNIVVKAKQDKGFFYYNAEEKAFISDAKKAKDIRITTVTSMSRFLEELGVDFSTAEINRLKKDFPKEYKKLEDAVFGIKDSLVRGTAIYKLSAKQANISSRLLQLGYIKAKLSNPEANSTYFNISGEQSQSYIGPNSPSQFYEAISSLDALTQEELSDYPQYNYLLTDVFAQGSRVLKRLFGSDKKRKSSESTENEELMMTGQVGGIDDQEKGKSKPSSKLNYRERLIQEFNLNIKGWYLNLIPGDSSLEHMTNLGNEIKASSLAKGMGDINKVFKDYFISELLLSREERPIVEVKLSKEDEANGKRQRRTTDLRFFKDILENKDGTTADEKNKLHDDIVSFEGTPEEVYAEFEKKINASLEKFIEKDVTYMTTVLDMYNLINKDKNGVSLKNIALPKNMNEQQFNREMTAITANYMIANIEMHKLIYSDPYQYAEELKRVKSFNSPRQLIVGNDDNMNQVFNDTWNKGFKKGDLGFTEFTTDSFKTVTLKDITGVSGLPGYTDYKETDGGGMIIQKAYRHFRIRAGEWNDAEERQYRYDVAYEKVVRGEGLTEAEKKKKGYALSEEEKAFNIERVETIDGKVKYVGKNPKVQSAYTNLKPIVSGNKADGNNYNDIVLDKFALYPLSFRILHELNPNSNALRMYDKMQNEGIDYGVYNSGRKVGAGSNPHEIYNDGKFNNTPFVKSGENKNTANVPFEIISVQSEVPSKEEALTRRGTQITKLITLDYMDGGVPIDFMEDTMTDEDDNFSERYKAWYDLNEDEKLEQSELYKEIKNNQNLLEAMTTEGVKSLLKSLGIQQVKTVDKKGRETFSYEITDFSKAGKTLRDEVLKREVNDNISDALKDFLEKGVALETTPAYQQIRNILYSIADREVISPKISGGMKVQIPVSLLESVKAKETEINGK